MKNLLIFIICLLASHSSSSQNTVGTLLNTDAAYNAYTLFAPTTSNQTYLINNCGQIINQWTSNFLPGASVYLLENGNLLRTAKITNSDISLGGLGGKIELFDWDNNLLWEYTYSSPLMSQHHDIYPLPNGNILMLAVTTLTNSEAIQAGRNPSRIPENKLYNEQILELQPIDNTEANIVWEWNIKDHLVQDFDFNKDNFGSVKNSPQLLDINFLNNGNGEANWLHFNSIQYNESLDQIIMSSRHLSEIYIIDHSTTTAEAATHSGGIYAKGGDFLYRWGNPKAYNCGTDDDQKLFSQHYPHWIPDGLNDAGKIMIFNNGNTLGYSSVDIINPDQSSPGVYYFDSVNGYSPLDQEWQYQAPNQTNFFSELMSSGQRLQNGNTLICDADSGYFFEIDSDRNIVWEYINPDSTIEILTQGDTPSNNLVFRAIKYSLDYPAFIGRDLTPGTTIEANSNLFCNILNVVDYALKESQIKIHPNPVLDYFTIEALKEIKKVEIYTISGQLLKVIDNTNTVNIEDLSSGIYLIKINTDDGSITRKIIKN
ncbi:aryl-sulfate sulfotransferase [Lacinutrix algicola]|uniref:aryl-sulfate sulfotransferase n=1 Tax=Lacinutrix algicola TaxID=342954 RepID=UPI0006E2C0FF|nr:aryl-sulfate sulfotransferase [Lacinutrix algicola]